jgi:hypothetical protein
MEEKEETAKIRVIVKEPGKEPEITEIPNNYDTISKTVNGLIDIIAMPSGDSIDIIFNDEFLYNGSEPNIAVPERETVIRGTVIVVGYDKNDGSSVSLTDEQIKTALRYCSDNAVVAKTAQA